MALPASGQISFNDARIEMSQSTMTDYYFSRWATGCGCYGDTISYQRYAPINVHSSNSGKYTTSCSNISMSSWYNYNHTLNYASDGTYRDLFFSFNATSCICCQASMIIFDLGTSNKDYDIRISGSTSDFTNVKHIAAWYGKPWSINGNGNGGASSVYYNSISGAALDVTINYNYTYNAGVGQYLYVVIYTDCT